MHLRKTRTNINLLRLVPRLTSKHVFLGLGKKMSVKLAAQAFSHFVYAGIMTYREQIRRDKGSFFEMMPCWRALNNLRSVAASSYLAPVCKNNSNCENVNDFHLIDLFSQKPTHEIHNTDLSIMSPTNNPCTSSSNLRSSQRNASRSAVKEIWKDSFKRYFEILEISKKFGKSRRLQKGCSRK